MRLMGKCTVTAAGFLQRLRADTKAIAMTEFAIVLPVLLTLGLYGTEIARLATSRTQVSQIALSLADNASRLGQTDNSGITPTVTENDVDALLDGAMRQGASIDLLTNGRIILSSLEVDDVTGRQYIHWQRCRGARATVSRYGDDGANNGLTGTPMSGIGSGSRKAMADPGSAIMFVEIEYEYDPLFQAPFGAGNRLVRQEAAFLIRDDRNLGDSSDPGLTGGNSDSQCN